MIASSVMRIQL